jgi:hypothetical protein
MEATEPKSGIAATILTGSATTENNCRKHQHSTKN